MKKKDVTEFVGKQVAIGVPHLQKEHTLFFYFGVLREASEKILVLKSKTGLKEIELGLVKDIHLLEVKE